MRITLRRTWGAPPEVFDVTWPQLVSWFEGHSQITFAPNPDRSRKPLDLPLVCFGAFDVPSPDGSLSYKRENLNPRGLSCLALDFDDTPADVFDQVLRNAMAPETGLHGYAHTTWKHGLTRLGEQVMYVRARIILEIETEIPVVHWPSFWDYSVRALRADVEGLDKSCNNPERTYYLPCTNPEAPWPCWAVSW